MRRNVLNSPRLSELKKRRRRVFLNKALIYFLVTGTIFALLAYLSGLPGINILEVEVSGNNIVDMEKITAEAREKLTGKYFWLLPKTNVLFYPKEDIAEALSEKYKRLKDIDLSVQGNRVLKISVAEREPLYTWCRPDIVHPTSEEKCYFLDNEGYVFDEAPYFSGSVYFKFYGFDGIDTANPPGAYFADKYFKNFVLFKNNLEAMEFKPVALHLKDDGDAELFLKSSKTPEPKIIFRADADPQILIENLSAALDTEPLKTRMQKEYSKLEYLDLRFENKVYSKFSK